MAIYENKIRSLLFDLRNNHGAIGVRAEFAAEGSRTDEIIRLKDFANQSGLSLTLKIGGCEALRDMHEARLFGAASVIAPMIESQYAVKKYLETARLAYTKEEQAALFINIETIQGYSNFDDMLKLPEIYNLAGIVLGRVDMAGSLGMKRDAINNFKLLEITKNIFEKAKALNMKCVLGGAVTEESIPFIADLGTLVDHYETRKIVFNRQDALTHQPTEGLYKAIEFELLWLKRKRHYHDTIFNEDNQRINLLQSRLKNNKN